MNKTKAHADQRNDPGPDMDDEVYAGEAAPVANKDKLDKITDLARDQVRLKRRKTKLEGELETTKGDLEANQTRLLPAAMVDANMESFTLTGGYTIEVEKILRASIIGGDAKKRAKDPDLAKRHEESLDYMEERAPPLVKRVLIAEFPKGEEKLFAKFIADLKKRKKPIAFTVDRSVHPSTLSKWLREEEAKERTVDETKISVHRVTVADVKEPD